MTAISAITVAELLSKSFPATEAILGDNLIDRQGAILVTGPQKVGKSLLGSQLALCLASRRSFLDIDVGDATYKTLILPAEVGEKRMKERFSKQASAYDAEAQANVLSASVFSSLQVDDADGVESIIAKVKESAVDVVIIDPLVNFHSGDENDARDMTAVINGLNQIRHAGAAVVLVHHHGKSSSRAANVGHRARGSSVIPGWYDSHVSMQWADQKDKTVRLDFELRNGEAPDSRIVRLNPASLHFEIVDSETGQIGMVLSVLREYGPSDADFVGERCNKTREWARGWLNRAVDAGRCLANKEKKAIEFYLPEQQVDTDGVPLVTPELDPSITLTVN